MAAMVPFAAKAAQNASQVASSALTHDLYVKRWTSTKGKGKKKKVVDHELHINPVSIAILGGAATLGVAAVGLGLWLSGNKAKLGGTKTVKRIVDEYQAVMETVTVVDTPAQTVIIPASDDQIWVPSMTKADWLQWDAGHYVTVHHAASSYTVPAVTHTEERVKTAMKTVVMSNRFVPHGTYTDYFDAITKMQARYKNPTGLKETSLVWCKLRDTDILRHFMEFTADSAIGITDRKGFSIGGGLFG